MAQFAALLVLWEFELQLLARYFTESVVLSLRQAGAWLASVKGAEFIRRSSEAWARVAIAIGTDESLAVTAANRTASSMIPRALSTPQSRRDSRARHGFELRVQGAARVHMDYENVDVQSERERCMQQLLPRLEEIVRVHYSAGGIELGTGVWTIDSTVYLPFQWINYFRPMARFENSERQQYRLVQHTEYRLATIKFAILSDQANGESFLEIQLPIRQLGSVIRDEIAERDRVVVRWSIPKEAVDVVEFNPNDELVEIMNRAVDEHYKITVRSHLGFDTALYALGCEPETRRSYPIPASGAEWSA